MNIRDLAKIAKVSPSTVSKVINHKSQGISEETQKRVWDVVKEYNYVPYQKIIKRLEVNGRLIGVLVPEIDAVQIKLIKGAERAAFENDFEIVVCRANEPVMLQNRINSLRRKKAEGVVFSCPRPFGEEITAQLRQEKFPLKILSSYHSYINAMRLAYKELINKGHTKIGLITSDLKQTDTQSRLDAYKQAVLKENRSFDISLVYESDGTQESGELGMRYLLSNDVSAVIAFDDTIAAGVYRLLQMEMLRVPQDISVLCFDDYDICRYLFPEPAIIETAYEELGYRAIIDLLSEIKGEGKRKAEIAATIRWGLGIAQRYEHKSRPGGKILVIGFLNMDTVIRVPDEAAVYDKVNINASDVLILPGGKASLQSVTVAKLGGNCYVIGRVGNDLNGEKIQCELSNHGINTGGIIFDDKNSTGKAVIYAPTVGKTSFDIDHGANMHFSTADLNQYTDLFSDAAYCLLQTELPRDAFYYAVRVCKQKSVKLICNVNPAFELDRQAFVGAYVLISTIAGVGILIPGKGSLEEKIGKLLESRCENVIISMEEDGEYLLVNRRQRLRFVVNNFKLVSHTAGMDCFTATLAVALTDGKTLEEAMAHAVAGATITMSREGSISSLPSPEELENELQQNLIEIHLA